MLRADPATARIPVIAVTASVMQQDRKQITEAGFDGYIGKPINLKEFLDSGARHARERRDERRDARRKVLVVDDTPQNVKLLADLLAVKGYARRDRGQRRGGARADRAEPPDLVLLDVMMPGMSGYDVCRRIRADPQTALLPVVLVTSLDPQQERVKGIEAGADDFLGKPINQPELFARVRSLLRIKALQDEVQQQAARCRNGTRSSRSASASRWRELERLSALKRFFSPAVGERSCRRATKSILAPHRREICYVFVDLRGFTAFTETAEPEEVQAVLREYHATMGALISRARGHARALRRRRHHDLLQRPDAGARRRAARGAHGARRCRRSSRRCARGGRSSATSSTSASASRKGFATLGAIGFEGRFDYAAIGGVVNLAARLVRRGGRRGRS